MGRSDQRILKQTAPTTLVCVRGGELGITGGLGATIAYAALLNGAAREVALYDIDAAKVHAEVLDTIRQTIRSVSF